jgi:glyoxylase-like metal-dependent hydrolase (beta-lactamase superfamily II)
MRISRAAGLVSALLAVVAAWSMPVHADDVRSTRLYVFDCGHADFKNMGMFSDTGEYDGKPGGVADPCFLIRHPKGTLLWDTGLGDKVAETKGGVDQGDVHVRVDVPLLEQLKSLGLTPADVTYVAFSHFHFDHTGNANAFTASTWILNKAELDWALSTPTPFGVDPTTFSAYKTVKTQMIDGDYDVFGDGSVRILKAPGHTPGHQALMVKLQKAGTVILSGDLYHLADNRKFRRIPGFNFSRADTLASIDRIEKLAKNTHARLIVQHDTGEFKALPKSPAYMD